jgi:primary-amine oxidase
MFIVTNKGSINQWGETRGYRIAPSLGAPIHLTIQDVENSVAKLSNRFAQHNIYVTKQKNTEPRSCSAWNAMDVYDPLVNFDAFFDGDSLDQEDL